MNTTHTAGMLTVRTPRTRGNNGYSNLHGGGEIVAVVHGSRLEAKANAARLALVWNTLAHLDNDAVERLGKWMEQHNSDELRDLLADEGF